MIKEKLLETSIKELAKIYKQILILRDLTDEYLKSKEDQFFIEAYNSIVHRIIPNFYSTMELLKKMQLENCNLYPSVGLLLRACLMDITTFYYLQTFQADEKTFKAEVQVTDLDFLKTIFKLKKIEDINTFEDELITVTKRDFSHFIKNNKEIEFFSNKEYRKNICQVNDSMYVKSFDFTRMTDDAKFSQIEYFGTSGVAFLKAKYKLYSQYQHFSFIGTKLFLLNDDDNLRFTIESIILISDGIAHISELYCTQPIHERIKESISILNQEIQ